MNPDDLDSASPDGALGIVLRFFLVAVGAVALFIYITPDEAPDAGADAEPVVEATVTAQPDVADLTTTAVTEAAPPTEATAATAVRPSTTVVTVEPEPAFSAQGPSGLFDPDDPTRRAIMKQGVVYLGGEIRSVQDANTIATKVARVVGPGNVYVEYRINPDAALSNEGILEVAELVLFDSNRATLRPEFTPLLELGVTLLATNPDVTIHVVAHTDTAGPEAANLVLSQERAEAITRFWTDAGIEPDRVSAEGKGETEPIADEAEPGGAQLNRRAEFVIKGLLG